MSSKDRRPYLSAVSLTQSLLDFCQDNLECRLELIVEIETPAGTIYASDRNKYVGNTFYEALLVFPVIGRTVGEWLSPDVQFSTLQLELSNVDGRFNNFLPGGANYGGWVGKGVVVKMGLAEQSGTYTTIFSGQITDVGGFRRTVKSIVVIARDNYEKLNATFPTINMTDILYPKIESKNVHKLLPVIYGDWTVYTEPAPATVFGYVVNGADPFVTFKERNCDISGPASPTSIFLISHGFDEDDKVVFSTSGTLPSPLVAGTVYYVKSPSQDDFRISATMGGADINTTTVGTGDHKVKPDPLAPKEPVHLVVSSNALSFFDTTQVYVKRTDEYWLVPASEITMIGLDNNEFTIDQDGPLWLAGAAYAFQESDLFFVKVKGKDLGAYTDNIVEQARDILITYGGASPGDFDANWDTFRDKASPAQSAIVNILSRVWLAEANKALSYALSMLEQVRLEAYISRDLKIKINSLHFEDWDSSPSFNIRNYDIVKDSFQTSIDDQNNFNAGQGVYNFLPDVNEDAYSTPIFNNPAAITQAGRRIAKKIVFPNLYFQTHATDQLWEILRLASSTLELVTTPLTWRSILLDIGDFVNVNVSIGSTIFENVPAMIRDIGYDPAGLKVVCKLWLMAMVPYPGYEPGYTGTVGGYSATIVEE